MLHLVLHILWHLTGTCGTLYKEVSESVMPTRYPHGPTPHWPVLPFVPAIPPRRLTCTRSPSRRHLSCCGHSFCLPLVCPDIAALVVKTSPVRFQSPIPCHLRPRSYCNSGALDLLVCPFMVTFYTTVVGLSIPRLSGIVPSLLHVMFSLSLCSLSCRSPFRLLSSVLPYPCPALFVERQLVSMFSDGHLGIGQGVVYTDRRKTSRSEGERRQP
jgi:hypothetical protein